MTNSIDAKSRHQFPRLFVLLGAHSRPRDGNIAWGAGFAAWDKVSSTSFIVAVAYPHQDIGGVSTNIRPCNTVQIQHPSSIVMWRRDSTSNILIIARVVRAFFPVQCPTTYTSNRRRWNTLIAFGAPQVDPVLVCGHFLITYLQHHVVGFLNAEAAVAKAYATQELAEHTDIYLLKDGSQAKFQWTPPHMPNGEVVLCCGQPMRVKKTWAEGGALIRVKLGCSVKSHEPGELLTRMVQANRSLEGVRKIMGLGTRRFTIYYSNNFS